MKPTDKLFFAFCAFLIICICVGFLSSHCNQNNQNIVLSNHTIVCKNDTITILEIVKE
jgi:hypothetical protein